MARGGQGPRAAKNLKAGEGAPFLEGGNAKGGRHPMIHKVCLSGGGFKKGLEEPGLPSRFLETVGKKKRDILPQGLIGNWGGKNHHPAK